MDMPPPDIGMGLLAKKLEWQEKWIDKRNLSKIPINDSYYLYNEMRCLWAFLSDDIMP